MAPRQRKESNGKLADNMRERDGYYTWRHPVSKREFGLGRDYRDAMDQAIEANMELAGEIVRPRLVDRLGGQEVRTWGKWCDELEQIIAGHDLAKNTRLARKSQLKKLRAMVDKDKPAAEVDTLECAKAVDALTKAGKRRTAQAFRSFLIYCFDRMIAKGWRKDNPADVTDAVTVKVKRARLPFSAFMKLYEKTEVAWLRNAMALALVSGQAREECHSAQFTDIRDGLWWNERAKTGIRIQLPLELRLDCFGMSLEDVVKQCRSTGILSRHLIHQTLRTQGSRLGKPVHVETITRTFTAELAKLGLDWEGKEPPTFHEIRSLSGRLYKVQGDVNPQELYGHRDPRTTATYIDGRGEWVKVSIRK